MKITLIIISLLILFLCVITATAQDHTAVSDKQKKRIALLGKVLWRTENNHCKSEQCYNIIDYQVLMVCEGELYSYIIKVGQSVASSENLSLSDEVCLLLEETDIFTYQAEVLEEVGHKLPEELMANYIYVGHGQACSCEVRGNSAQP